jgi:cytochrome b involved in lipid metabolism
MASPRLVALLFLASVSFVILLMILFMPTKSSDENIIISSSQQRSEDKNTRRRLDPVPPISSQDNNNNNNVVADDPVEQFFSSGLKDHPLDQCPQNFFTKQDLAQHNTENDLWILIHGYVLNVTNFVHHHPGGVQMIMKGGGGEKDAADLFVSYHQPGTISLFNSFCIGRIKKS